MAGLGLTTKLPKINLPKLNKPNLKLPKISFKDAAGFLSPAHQLIDTFNTATTSIRDFAMHVSDNRTKRNMERDRMNSENEKFDLEKFYDLQYKIAKEQSEANQEVLNPVQYTPSGSGMNEYDLLSSLGSQAGETFGAIWGGVGESQNTGQPTQGVSNRSVLFLLGIGLFILALVGLGKGKGKKKKRRLV